jgi:hypothetical protein
MRTTKFYKWLLPMMMITSYTAFAQIDSRTPGVFGPQGPQQNGPVVFPDGNYRFPAETRVNQRSQNRDDAHRKRSRHYNNRSCSMPPGQAKKIYGGEARDYANAKKECGKRRKQDRYDDNWNYRNERRQHQSKETKYSSKKNK